MTTTTTSSTPETGCQAQRINWFRIEGLAIGIYEQPVNDHEIGIDIRVAESAPKLADAPSHRIGAMRSDVMPGQRVQAISLHVIFAEPTKAGLRAAFAALGGRERDAETLFERVRNLIYMYEGATLSEIREVLQQLRSLHMEDIEWLR